MEITGKAIAALPVRKGVSQRTGNEWMTREYVIETQEQYPKKIVFEVFGREKIENFNIRKDDIITVSFDIDAREHDGRWYNSVRAWKVEHVSSGVATPTPTQQPTPFVQTTNQQSQPNDDVPF